MFEKRLTKEIYIVLKRIWLEDLDEKFYSFIGINHVKVNKNLSTVVVFLSFEALKDSYSSVEIFKKLKKLNPFLKYKLTNRLKLPPHFKLVFEEDSFIEQAKRVESLINESLNN